MKQAITEIEFFMNRDNMEYLMKGYTIKNFDDIKDLIFAESETPFIYAARKYDPKAVLNATSEYPNSSDTIMGKILGYLEKDGKRYLKIEFADTLTYSMINNPCIKVNGYCTVNSDDSITINKITRVTIADRTSGQSDLFLPS